MSRFLHRVSLSHQCALSPEFLSVTKKHEALWPELSRSSYSSSQNAAARLLACACVLGGANPRAGGKVGVAWLGPGVTQEGARIRQIRK